MIDNYSRASFDEREQSKHFSVKAKKNSQERRKLKINQKYYDPKNSHGSSSLYFSNLKSPNSVNEIDIWSSKGQTSALAINHLTEKYLPRGMSSDNLCAEMKSIIERKVNELESIRIYRDELKFITTNQTSIKLNLSCFREKAKIEESMKSQKYEIQHDLKEFESEQEMMNEYSQVLKEIMKEKVEQNMIDIGKEEEIILQNLQFETNHLIKELGQQKRRNLIESKQIQEEILDLRIIIKQKEDSLRDLKARICTLHIKLHNRNSQRNGSKSKERNLSMSIKKFNNQHHSYIKEAFIGNNQFKNFSREVIEKVSSDEELLKLRIIKNSKENITFQCIYKSKEGSIHSFREFSPEMDNETTRDKISEETQKVEEVYIKYLFNIKFYFKSKIVGVQYRVKTQKGNKHIQIGNCNPNIQHQLLTLINKQVVTLGSFWHGKQMIGVSIWYSEKLSTINKNSQNSAVKKINKRASLKSYDQYYV